MKNQLVGWHNRAYSYARPCSTCTQPTAAVSGASAVLPCAQKEVQIHAAQHITGISNITCTAIHHTRLPGLRARTVNQTHRTLAQPHMFRPVRGNTAEQSQLQRFQVYHRLRSTADVRETRRCGLWNIRLSDRLYGSMGKVDDASQDFSRHHIFRLRTLLLHRRTYSPSAKIKVS